MYNQQYRCDDVKLCLLFDHETKRQLLNKMTSQSIHWGGWVSEFLNNDTLRFRFIYINDGDDFGTGIKVLFTDKEYVEFFQKFNFYVNGISHHFQLFPKNSKFDGDESSEIAYFKKLHKSILDKKKRVNRKIQNSQNTMILKTFTEDLINKDPIKTSEKKGGTKVINVTQKQKQQKRQQNKLEEKKRLEDQKQLEEKKRLDDKKMLEMNEKKVQEMKKLLDLQEAKQREESTNQFILNHYLSAETVEISQKKPYQDTTDPVMSKISFNKNDYLEHLNYETISPLPMKSILMQDVQIPILDDVQKQAIYARCNILKGN